MRLADANNGGNVHGGVIMYLCDEVAGIAAVRHSGCRVVTVAMDRMTFLHPVYVGHLVTRQGDGQRRLAHLDGGGRAGGGREHPLGRGHRTPPPPT